MKEDMNNLITTINIFQWIVIFIVYAFLVVLSIPFIILMEIAGLIVILYCTIASGINSIWKFFTNIL